VLARVLEAQTSNPSFKLELFVNRQEIELVFKMPFLVNYIEQNSLMVLNTLLLWVSMKYGLLCETLVG